ncbi:hypothetical protein G7046_g7994 [Stylonectria norvegica]|nr:hypothetical protein G7046_g7994 [Stylonectria norvegica]
MVLMIKLVKSAASVAAAAESSAEAVSAPVAEVSTVDPIENSVVDDEPAVSSEHEAAASSSELSSNTIGSRVTMALTLARNGLRRLRSSENSPQSLVGNVAIMAMFRESMVLESRGPWRRDSAVAFNQTRLSGSRNMAVGHSGSQVDKGKAWVLMV